MNSNFNSNFKSDIRPLLNKQLNLIRKIELKRSLQKLNPNIQPATSSKNQLINDIMKQLQLNIEKFKQSIDGVNQALQYLKNWFLTEFGQVIKNPSYQSLEYIISREFKGLNDSSSKSIRNIKNNQTPVINIWSDEKFQQYPCICPKGPASLCGSKQQENCYKCGVLFHPECLWGKSKDNKISDTLPECPSCFLINCLPHKKVQKVLFAGYLTTTKSNKIQFLVQFQLSDEIKNDKTLLIEARCIRIKSVSDLNRYELTWPDNSTVFLNSKKISEYKPLTASSALKRRTDEELVLDKAYTYCDVPQRLVIEEKHQREASSTKYEYASHFVMIFAVNLQKKEGLLQKFTQSRLSVQESKEILKNYLSCKNSNDIQVQKLGISLMCPLYFNKISIPVRSKHCSTHFQPFDLNNFIQVNKTTGKGIVLKYKCPICKKRAYDLVVDQYLQDLINSKSGGQNFSQITFRADGEPHFEQEDISQAQSQEENNNKQEVKSNVVHQNPELIPQQVNTNNQEANLNEQFNDSQQKEKQNQIILIDLQDDQQQPNNRVQQNISVDQDSRRTQRQKQKDKQRQNTLFLVMNQTTNNVNNSNSSTNNINNSNSTHNINSNSSTNNINNNNSTNNINNNNSTNKPQSAQIKRRSQQQKQRQSQSNRSSMQVMTEIIRKQIKKNETQKQITKLLANNMLTTEINSKPKLNNQLTQQQLQSQNAIDQLRQPELLNRGFNSYNKQGQINNSSGNSGYKSNINPQHYYQTDYNTKNNNNIITSLSQPNRPMLFAQRTSAVQDKQITDKYPLQPIEISSDESYQPLPQQNNIFSRIFNDPKSQKSTVTPMTMKHNLYTVNKLVTKNVKKSLQSQKQRQKQRLLQKKTIQRNKLIPPRQQDWCQNKRRQQIQKQRQTNNQRDRYHTQNQNRQRQKSGIWQRIVSNTQLQSKPIIPSQSYEQIQQQNQVKKSKQSLFISRSIQNEQDNNNDSTKRGYQQAKIIQQKSLNENKPLLVRMDKKQGGQDYEDEMIFEEDIGEQGNANNNNFNRNIRQQQKEDSQSYSYVAGDIESNRLEQNKMQINNNKTDNINSNGCLVNNLGENQLPELKQHKESVVITKSTINSESCNDNDDLNNNKNNKINNTNSNIKNIKNINNKNNESSTDNNNNNSNNNNDENINKRRFINEINSYLNRDSGINNGRKIVKSDYCQNVITKSYTNERDNKKIDNSNNNLINNTLDQTIYEESEENTNKQSLHKTNNTNINNSYNSIFKNNHFQQSRKQLRKQTTKIINNIIPQQQKQFQSLTNSNNPKQTNKSNTFLNPIELVDSQQEQEEPKLQQQQLQSSYEQFKHNKKTHIQPFVNLYHLQQQQSAINKPKIKDNNNNNNNKNINYINTDINRNFSKANYDQQLKQLRQQMEKNRQTTEKYSKLYNIRSITEDDQKLFYQLIQEVNTLNNYEVF